MLEYYHKDVPHTLDVYLKGKAMKLKQPKPPDLHNTGARRAMNAVLKDDDSDSIELLEYAVRNNTRAKRQAQRALDYIAFVRLYKQVHAEVTDRHVQKLAALASKGNQEDLAELEVLSRQKGDVPRQAALVVKYLKAAVRWTK